MMFECSLVAALCKPGISFRQSIPRLTDGDNNIMSRDPFPLILSSISASPQSQFIWTIYANAGRDNSASTNARLITQQWRKEKRYAESASFCSKQYSVFLISFICRTGDFHVW